MFSSRLLAAVFASLVLAAAAARAAVDFTGIDGTYVGTYTLNLGGTLVSGRVTATIEVPESGKKARLELVGTGNFPSTPGALIALWGTHTFRSNRAISSDNIFMALYVLVPALPTKFSGSAKRFSFVLSNPTSSVGDALMAYTIAANGKRLTITGAGHLTTQDITISFSGKRVGKKNP